MSEAELPKTYDPTAVEAEAYQIWLDEKCFQADPAHPGDPYCIVIPPPNVTGALHLGHAINNTLQDILTRQHRMAGFNTLWVPGIDHAGIATQAVVEKQLKEKENKTRHDVGREGLVERIWTWKQQYGDRILEQLKRLGCSCDWSRTRFTLDEMCAKAVRETFFKLFKNGLIYRGKRLVNWDVHLQTSISDDEIYHETVKTSLWHIRYPIVDGPSSPSTGNPGEGRGEGDFARPITGTADPMVKETEILETGADLESFPADPDTNVHLQTDAEAPDAHPGLRPKFMTVATTRPETLLGDTAVAVHSQDPRWNWAIGKFVKLPLANRLIPIIADDILVDPKFGSGVVKVTPAHDPNDYAVWQRQAGKIEILNILNANGTLNENAGPYAGMKRDPARKKVVEDLTAQGLLEKEEPYETQVGHSDRSKTAVEPYLSDQWFVKMAPLAEPALEVVRDGTIKFFPERHAQQYLSWLGEKRDWPVSRQLWWGHRIPVWRRSKRLERPLESIELAQLMTKLNEWRDQGILAYQFLSDVDGITPLEAADPNLALFYICLREDPKDPQLLAILEKYDLIQDPDVLDTWFSSALWPHSTLGWPEQTADLAKWYPTSVLMTGRDIITLWVARMVMAGLYNMKGIPFHHVAINPTILDGKGERMSKSKGNGVDPVDIIDTHGADALRFTLTSMATETQDVRLPVKKDSQGRNTSDRFDIGRNFCNKLWNAARFALSNLQTIPPLSPSPGILGEGGGEGSATSSKNAPHPNPPPEYRRRGEETALPDRWIISRFNHTVEEANAALAIYRFDQYAKTCYDFFWRDFCDWYVEAIKPAMKDPKRAVQTADTLTIVLDGTLRLMHPMIPFITERLWWGLNAIRPQRGAAVPSKRLIQANWPTPGPIDASVEQTFSALQEIIISIRNVRNENKADVKKPVTVSISTASLTRRESIEQNREIIELLASCNIGRLAAELPTPPSAIRTLAAGCEILIEGLAPLEGETDVTAKQCEALKQKAAILRSRLSNESYASKAPAHLVQQTRDELAAAEAEMAKLGCGAER